MSKEMPDGGTFVDDIYSKPQIKPNANDHVSVNINNIANVNANVNTNTNANANANVIDNDEDNDTGSDFEYGYVNNRSERSTRNNIINTEETPDDAIIRAENLVKIYKTKDIEVLALQGLDLVIEHGELMAIIGNSGSGKSTLLNMLGGLDRPSAGSLTVDGKDLFKISESELSDYRRLDVGFVWQNNARNLIPYLSALHNVMLPMNINNHDERLRYETQRREWAIELLDMVGLASSAKKRLGELSGGEQQRVALAIGLSNRPKILLADEPTGSVDQATCRQIMEIFRRFNQALGVTIIIVTHDRTLTKMVNRVVAIRDGKTSSEILVKENLRERLASITDFEGIETHEEFAVLDRVGRVQIPEDFLHRLALSGNTVKLEFNDGHVTMTKPDRQ